MQSIKRILSAIADWLFVGKRLPLIIVAFILVATGVTVAVATTLNAPEQKELVTAYITVKGLGDDKDIENRQIKIHDGDSLKQIFSYEYPEIYEAFGQPLIQYNEFATFMGVRKTSSQAFHVTIDGLHDNNLDQAYVYGGQTVVIEYY